MAGKLRNTFPWQRTKKRMILSHFFLATSVLLSYCLVHFLTAFRNETDTRTETSGGEITHGHRYRLLLSVNESTSSKGEYPEDLFTLDQKRKGVVILHIIGMCYMFLAISIACDEFFIPVLAVITEKLNISEDIAGATFMAAGGSMPELCISFVGVFAAPDSNVGFGTIVGSAVFNVLFVIGMCAVFSKELLTLTWWPLFRDCMFYIVALVILIVFFRDGEIEWWESLALIITYFMYVTFMKFNHRVERWVKGLLKSNKVNAIGSKSSDTSNPGVNRGDLALEKAMENLCLSSRMNNGPPCFRHGALQLVIHSIDPLGEASIAVKVNKLKRLKCLDVKVGMERETESAFGIPDPVKGIFPEDHSRQFQLSVVNNSLNVQDVCQERNNSANTSSSQNHLQDTSNVTLQKNECNCNKDSRKELFYSRRGDDSSRDSNLVNGELPTIRVYPDRNGHSLVPGMCDQPTNRTPVGSRGSLSTAPSHSSHHHLIDVENAREACLDDGGEPLDLRWPKGWRDRLVYLVRAPILYLMYFTTLDVRRPERRHLYPWSFVWSVFWIGWFSYFMVWWATEVGETLHIPIEVMGLTFLAAGTSIPDLITSVLVARKGFGDMAVSSSIGSNMFDITVGLPLPWVIYSAVNNGNARTVNSTSLFCSVFLLFVMLLAVITTIAASKWRMSKLLGATMFVLYILFLLIALLLQFQVISCPL